MKVSRATFENVVRKLLATPPMPKAVVSRKIARTARPKQKPAVPQSGR